MVLVVRSVFHESDKYYLNIFLDECLYKLAKKIMTIKYFDSIIMFRFDETKVGKIEFYDAKKLVKTWDVDIDNIVISKLIETKNNSKYLTGYLDQVRRPLALMLPKTSGYV